MCVIDQMISIHVDAQAIGALEERQAENASDNEIEIERELRGDKVTNQISHEWK